MPRILTREPYEEGEGEVAWGERFIDYVYKYKWFAPTCERFATVFVILVTAFSRLPDYDFRSVFRCVPRTCRTSTGRRTIHCLNLSVSIA